MILCLTPNPAIDRTLHVNALRLSKVHRVEKMLAAAGGTEGQPTLEEATKYVP